jgi:hypothetical protein
MLRTARAEPTWMIRVREKRSRLGLHRLFFLMVQNLEIRRRMVRFQSTISPNYHNAFSHLMAQGDLMATPPLPNNPSIDEPPLTPEPIPQTPDPDEPDDPPLDPDTQPIKPAEGRGRQPTAFPSLHDAHLRHFTLPKSEGRNLRRR